MMSARSAAFDFTFRSRRCLTRAIAALSRTGRAREVGVRSGSEDVRRRHGRIRNEHQLQRLAGQSFPDCDHPAEFTAICQDGGLQLGERERGFSRRRRCRPSSFMISCCYASFWLPYVLADECLLSFPLSFLVIILRCTIPPPLMIHRFRPSCYYGSAGCQLLLVIRRSSAYLFTHDCT